MRIRIILLLILGTSEFCYSQIKDEIKKQVQVVVDATLAHHYETVIEKTYPSLIKLMGGKEIALKTITDGMNNLESQNIRLDSVIIGTPRDIYIAGDELHVLVPETLVMSTPKGKLVTLSYSLAISKDDGVTWLFLDVGERTNKNIVDLLPNFNNDLIIPPKQKPILYSK